ncbi:hypothetical protein GCM10020331_049240 [Ectobacillus funiculus]
MATFKEFRNDVKPNWCPGCGDFSVQAAIQRAAANAGLDPEQMAVVSGIGCSGRISGYINSYGFHGIHGRALPIAQGVKNGEPRFNSDCCGWRRGWFLRLVWAIQFMRFVVILI